MSGLRHLASAVAFAGCLEDWMERGGELHTQRNSPVKRIDLERRGYLAIVHTDDGQIFESRKNTLPPVFSFSRFLWSPEHPFPHYVVTYHEDESGEPLHAVLSEFEDAVRVTVQLTREVLPVGRGRR